MAKHLVTMLVGVVVEAASSEEANDKATLPFRLGLVPGMVGIATTGSRPAVPSDEDGSIQATLTAMATKHPVQG